MYTLVKHYPNKEVMFKKVTCGQQTGWHCSETDGGCGDYVCTFPYGRIPFLSYVYTHMQSYSCAAKYTFGFLVC